MEKLIIFYYISINFDSVLEIVFARLYSRKMVNNVVENAKWYIYLSFLFIYLRSFVLHIPFFVLNYCYNFYKGK
jgi:hypothetical protein